VLVRRLDDRALDMRLVSGLRNRIDHVVYCTPCQPSINHSIIKGAEFSFIAILVWHKTLGQILKVVQHLQDLIFTGLVATSLLCNSCCFFCIGENVNFRIPLHQF
jgi:hypothetical protein